MRARVAAALLLVVAARARAAVVIRLDADATVAAAEVRLGLAATNTGSEAARDLVPEVTWLDRRRRGEAVAVLPPGARRPWDFSLPLPPAAGTFPLVLRLRCTDAAGRPASALLVRAVGAGGAGPVRAALAPAPIATVGTVQLALENPEGRAVAGRVVAVLPPELATDPESQPAQVPPGGHLALPLVVQNAHGVVGAAYPMYAVFEYDWQGAHHTALATATLPVIAAPSRRGLRLAVGATASLAALAAAALLSRRAARRAAHSRR